MVETTQRPADSGTKNGVRICDVDVHEMVPSGAVLMPYLDERWHLFGTPSPVIGLTLYNQVQGAVRDDTLPHLHGYPPGLPGSSIDLLREQLLDPFDYDLAVLTGFFHVGGMRTQYEYWQAMASAYNRWLADAWLGRDARIAGSIQVAMQEPEAAAEEIERHASNPGFVQVM